MEGFGVIDMNVKVETNLKKVLQLWDSPGL